MRSRVLVFAQQAPLRAAIARFLLPKGYQVEITSSERRARQLLEKERFEAAIIAAGSFDKQELAFLREAQSAVRRLAIVVDDANDARRFASSFPGTLICISRPLEHEKLLKFIASSSSSKSSTDETATPAEFISFEGCLLDVPGHVFLNASRQAVSLTRAEFALLVSFVRNAGRVLSRSQLRAAIDGGKADAYDRSIDMLIARLRRKIEPKSVQARFIVTVPGVGYKFVPRVRRGESPGNPSARATYSDYSGRDTRPAERRQLTVLSCQILGFAALAAQLDPEDLEILISRIYTACAEVITRFGGTMMRTMGDSILANFGHPRAHENNAESAVRAALELLRAVSEFEAAPIGQFRARIGVATGLMIISELSSVETRELTAVGEALNLALHMQKSAPPDSVLIAATTRDLVGRFFHCREFEPVVLEQGHEPASAWRVVAQVAGITRFEALRRGRMHELVGRGPEIERLAQCWSNVLHSSGQIVMLRGEGGIGKSRLVVELEQRLRCEPHATVRYSGSPHLAEAPMSVLLAEVERSAGLTPNDTATQKLRKLRRVFDGLGAATAEATALSSALLGLPSEQAPDVSQLSPQKRKERTFATLLARIERAVSRQPVLVIVEDVQWVDPTSLEFFVLLIERAAALRILMIVIGRPEFTPPWPDYSHICTLALSRLSRSDSTALIQQVVGGRRIPAQIEAQILSRSEGVPLFVEELTISVLEHSDGKSLRSLRPDGTRSVPAQLHGLLLSRFDLLERGREIAQAGAVIGQEFSRDLLRVITNMDEPTLASALDKLVISSLVFRRGSQSQPTFVFKHALLRDIAYGTLVRRQRRKLHAGVARAYEERFPETVEAQPELLAYHHREAGNSIEAVGYLLAGAQRAVLRSAAPEALAHLAEVRDLVSALPQSRDRLQLECKLEITSAQALMAQRGYAARQTRDAYQRARERCEALGDQHWLPLVIHGQWVGAWISAEFQSALKTAEQLYAWSQHNGDPTGTAVAHLDFAMTLTNLGDLVHARHHLEQALRINQFILPGRQSFMFSDTEPGRISALSYLHYCLLLLGFPDQAKAVANEASAVKPHQLYTQALAQIFVLRTHVFERNVSDAAEIGTAVVQLSRDLGYPYLIGTSMVHAGWALAQSGDTVRGTDYCQTGLTTLRTIGVKCWLPLYLALLAECYERAGDYERSAQSLAEALGSLEATGEHVWESEIYRLKGRCILAAGGDTSMAKACFATALDKARRQRMKLLELRAAMSLADLLERERRATQARDVLAPVYASFTEGFDFIDLREARVFLDALSD
jgi:predicted ATPase/class 3 adenylate cyclase/DNA-binding response OmpR family regulator